MTATVDRVTHAAPNLRVIRERGRLRERVKDKTYQRSAIGQECKRCLEQLQWEGAPLNTRDSYEIAWCRFDPAYADLQEDYRQQMRWLNGRAIAAVRGSRGEA